jgi:ATP-dependent Lon protease
MRDATGARAFEVRERELSKCACKSCCEASGARLLHRYMRPPDASRTFTASKRASGSNIITDTFIFSTHTVSRIHQFFNHERSVYVHSSIDVANSQNSAIQNSIDKDVTRRVRQSSDEALQQYKLRPIQRRLDPETSRGCGSAHCSRRGERSLRCRYTPRQIEMREKQPRQFVRIGRRKHRCDSFRLEEEIDDSAFRWLCPVAD